MTETELMHEIARLKAKAARLTKFQEQIEKISFRTNQEIIQREIDLSEVRELNIKSNIGADDEF